MTDLAKAAQFKNLGNEAFKNKNYEQAIKYFTQAIECNPNDHVFYSNRSGSYLNAGNHQKALEDAETCVKLNPNWARGHQRKGTALFYLNRLQQAVDAYKQGLKIEPENQQLKSDLKTAEDKQMQAQQGMLQAYLKLAGNPETKQFLSDPGFMQKVQAIMQNPAAYALFANDPKIKKAYEVINQGGMPNNFDFEEFMKKMDTEQPPKAQSAQSQQKYEKMDEQIPSPPPKREPRKKAEDVPPPPKQQQPKVANPAEDAKNEGNNEYKKKNFEKAVEWYQKAIDLNPNEPLYYNNKAAAYIQLGNFAEAHSQLDKAEQIFENGVKDFTKKGKVLARRASLLAKEGKLQQSIDTYQKSLLEDGVQKVRDELKAVQKLKKEKQAKEYLNPQLAEKACEAGNTLFKEGKFPAALKQYEEAIKRNPDGAKYYSNLGTVYIKLMEFERAKTNFQTALKKDPQYVKAYPKKGDCHYFLKQYHKALESYESGLKVDPNNELCKAGIAKTNQAIYASSGGGGSQEEKIARAKKAMADPQIQKILQTPEVANALQDLQKNPQAIQNIMKDPNLAAQINKLIQAGVIG